jgi:hypothetical protein
MTQENKKILSVGEEYIKSWKLVIQREYNTEAICINWEDLRGEALVDAAVKNNVDGVIAHTFRKKEIEQMIDVHKQGIPIVGMTSMWRAQIDPHLGWVDAENLLKEAGVPTFEKLGNSGVDLFLFLYGIILAKQS